LRNPFLDPKTRKRAVLLSSLEFLWFMFTPESARVQDCVRQPPLPPWVAV
jgi:hypothetical protein